MRSDLEDFEDIQPEASNEPRSRAMSWLVLGVAVTGFAALAYYAYQSGTRSLSDSNILEIAAEEGPIKKAPEDPGGEEFPHQDKTIYDALTGEGSQQKVEKLLPEPEEPVMPEPAIGQSAELKAKETTTYVNSAATETEDKQETSAASSAPAAVAQPPAPVAKPLEEPKPAAPPVEEAKPVETPAAPKPEVKEIPKAEPVLETKSAPMPSAAGEYKIQLGAYPSEEEANKEWNSIRKKHASVLRGDSIVVRAELPNGVFYRLRAGGFASVADAKAACAKLTAAKQPCFYVGK